MRSIPVLSLCTNDTARWARSLTNMPTWAVATAYRLTLAEAERVQAIVADLAAQAERDA